jgi:hypothetical protein
MEGYGVSRFVLFDDIRIPNIKTYSNLVFKTSMQKQAQNRFV